MTTPDALLARVEVLINGFDVWADQSSGPFPRGFAAAQAADLRAIIALIRQQAAALADLHTAYRALLDTERRAREGAYARGVEDAARVAAETDDDGFAVWPDGIDISAEIRALAAPKAETEAGS